MMKPRAERTRKLINEANDSGKTDRGREKMKKLTLGIEQRTRGRDIGGMKNLPLVIFGWLIFGMNVQAASFDCGKAASKIERLICGDDELSKMDGELNEAYRKTLGQEGKQKVTQEQRRWLKEVRNACQDSGCMRLAYKRRIDELIALAKQAPADIGRDEKGVPEENNAATLTETHARDLERLKRLLKEGKILDVSTDMKKDDPDYVRGEAFCHAQVKALKEEDPSLGIPKPQYVFQGKNALDEFAEFRIDDSVPEGKVRERCAGTIKAGLQNTKFYQSAIFEVFTYPDISQYRAVFFDRWENKAQYRMGMGFKGYIPIEGCSAIVGYARDFQSNDYDFEFLVGLYALQNDHVFYRGGKIDVDDIRPRIRLLFFQPQYNGTPHAWYPDENVIETRVPAPKEVDNHTYRCRLDVAVPIQHQESNH